jgi:hypothetical protein
MPKVVGCFAMAAQLQTADRRARHRKLVRHDGLRETVEERLRSGWTPEGTVANLAFTLLSPAQSGRGIDRRRLLRGCAVPSVRG